MEASLARGFRLVMPSNEAAAAKSRPPTRRIPSAGTWAAARAVVAFGAAVGGALAEPYRLSEPGPHWLQTGTGEPLQSWSVTLAPPMGIRATSLEFTVGFSSVETPSSGDFLDAFSVSLATWGGATPRQTAMVVTADAPGPVWLPPLPGGLSLETASLRTRPVDWSLPPDLTPGPKYSYRVTLDLAAPFQRDGFSLVADLFDNTDLRVSLGYVSDVVLKTDPFLLVESAASPAGPFAVETGARHDPVNRLFTLVRPDVARFFRLYADSVSVLTILEPTEDRWRFRYVFPGSTPALESAANPGGPYAPEPDAVLDAEARMFRLPVSASAEGRFFRLRGAVRTELAPPRVRNGQIELAFEFHPHAFGLHSSAQPCGPFADEMTARFDLAAQTIELRRPEEVRFFRLVGDSGSTRVRIRELRVVPGAWVLAYENEGGAK